MVLLQVCLDGPVMTGRARGSGARGNSSGMCQEAFVADART